jgi:predicted DCC family thiol-disulfide oxidoreductase YuxK
VLVFDGDCGFCRFWVQRWRVRTGERLECVPFQSDEIERRFPGLSLDRCRRAVQLVEPDGTISEGAGAVFRALAAGGVSRIGPLLYERLPGFAPVTELAYRFVASHRPLADRVRKCAWGDVVEPSTYCVASWSFLRLLGLTYLFAFWSLGTQIVGLVGRDGIVPASTSDALLRALCVSGSFLSVLLTAGVGSAIVLPVLWVLYLWLSNACGEFLGYQWDALLLEAGLIAVFLAPFVVRERPRDHASTPRLARRLLVWLLFRLMIGSGAVKLASGDPAWRGLTALLVHYETQPLPTPLAWYAHQLPAWFQKISVAGVFAVELGVPWLILAPRRIRMFGAFVLAGLQALIALTGNYAFFNFLTASLCVLLIDDAAFGATNRLRDRRVRDWSLRVLVTIAFAAVTVPVSLLMFTGSIGVLMPGAELVFPLADFVQPLRSVNGYGLFAVMTTTRDEIVVEGSSDGREWKTYEFRYKPGDVYRRPAWVAPHQPRVDWQMWFAALAPFEQGGWFHRFCFRLLEGSPDVLKLLASNPFPDRPPKFVRGMLYRYHFTDRAAGRRTGAWWTRELLGRYSPVMSLQDTTAVR